MLYIEMNAVLGTYSFSSIINVSLVNEMFCNRGNLFPFDTCHVKIVTSIWQISSNPGCVLLVLVCDDFGYFQSCI